MKRLLFAFLISALLMPVGGTQAQTAGPTITSFGVTGGEFLIEGEMATFNWTSSNASYCMADGDWSGTRDASGSFNLYISQVGYGRYQLICYDSLGNRSSSAVLTPFVGSAGKKKQSGSIAVVSAKVTSSDPSRATIVAELTQIPQAASIVLFEQTVSPAETPEKVSMFLPSTALQGSTVTFRFDGPARPTAGKSYGYSITAQGSNATDLTTYHGVITIDVDFRFETVRVGTSSMANGDRIETEKNVYVTFSHPAKNVKTQVSSMNDAGTALTDEYVKTYEYPLNLYQTDQKSFAAGTFSGLPLGKKFQYVVEGQERGTGKSGSYTGTFTTAPDIQVSDGNIMPSYSEAYITWKTNVPTGSGIEYYTTDPKNTQFAFSEQEYPQTFHKVTVKDLKPDTEYKAIIHAYIHNEDGETDTTKKMSPITFRTKVATSDMIVCPAQYDPVCGKDNKTYSNTCYANAAKASIAYKGECKPFKISSLRVDKLDALGKATEEERSFAIQTSDPFSKIVVSLWEAPNTSITQAPYTTATVQGNGTLTSIYVSPGVFDKKLRPNKTYKYLVTAYKYGATEDLNTSVGDTFATPDFVSRQFDIEKVDVTAFDNAGLPSQDTRTFTVWLNGPFSKLDVKIVKVPFSGDVNWPSLDWNNPYTSESTKGDGMMSKVTLAPTFDKKFLPNTRYAYTVFADAYEPKKYLNANTFYQGTFITSDYKGLPITLEGRVYKAGDEPYETLYRDFGVSYKTDLFKGKKTETLSVYEQATNKRIAYKDLNTEQSFVDNLKANTTYRYIYEIVDENGVYGAAQGAFTTGTPPIKKLEGRVYKAGDEPYEALYRDFGVSYKAADFVGKLVQTLTVYEQPGDKLFAKKDLSLEHSFVSGLKPNTKYSYVYQIVDERGVTGKAEGTFETGTPPKPKEEQKAFAIVSVRVEKQTQVGDNGGIVPLEHARDLYPTFSRSAKQVKLDVYRKKNNARITTYEYPEQFVTKEKTGFALSVFGLESSTEYRYVITGRAQDTGELTRYEGEFTTAKFDEKKPFPDVSTPPEVKPPSELPEQGLICGQAITYGRNSATGQIRAFPTTCLPAGWEHVPYSELGTIEQPKKGGDDKREQQTKEIEEKVKLLTDRKLETILSEIQQLRDKVKEQDSELKYLRKISVDVKELREEMQDALTTFVTYGVDSSTKHLGAGERAAVVRSYQSAYSKLPNTDKELEDMIRIANGRFPSERNEAAEKRANLQFKRIFKRVANLRNDNDRAAIMVMAYGMRQAAENRNLNSESRGITTFKSIYGSVPQKTEEWNIMQAITYSGASRKKDSDKDLLADEDEKDYGSDSSNPDSDGDGFADGLEVENGFSPVGEGTLES